MPRAFKKVLEMSESEKVNARDVAYVVVIDC